MNKRIITDANLNDFKEYLRTEERSKATITKYLHDLIVFKSFVGDGPIDKSKVLEYKEMLGNKFEVSSANSMIAAVNTFFKFMDWLDCHVKQFKVQKKIFCSEDTELSRNEYQRLVKAAKMNGNERLNLIIQTICCTGIRVSELQHITVEAVKRGEAVVRCKGKTRTVFIVKELRRSLMQYIRQNKITEGVIFVTKHGNPMNRSNIWREMKALCKKAMVSPEKVFPHNLRHLFARTFYGIEKDIAKLADILGHSSINTTRIYIVSTGKEHRRRMENMRLAL